MVADAPLKFRYLIMATLLDAWLKSFPTKATYNPIGFQEEVAKILPNV